MAGGCVKETLPHASHVLLELCWLATEPPGGGGTRPMGSVNGEKVVIAGAGIAGMTAALYLLEAGFDVAILEKRDRVGGKFGAVRVSDDTVHEHAYHFLADWCVNLRAVMEKIRLGTPHLQPSHGVSFLRPRRQGGPLSARLATLRLEELG